MFPLDASLAEKRRILQLETLHDLALALSAPRPESELIEELLQRITPVLDPTAAVAATCDIQDEIAAVVAVGWPDEAALGEELAEELRRLRGAPGLLKLRNGAFCGRSFRQLIAAPITHRDEMLGGLWVLDKEARQSDEPRFSDEEQRFLESVAVLGGAALENLRQKEFLERQRERLEEENRALREDLVADLDGERIVAHAPAMQRALERVRRVAPRGVPVVVRGESGTGKELIARLLHLESGRSGALVAINCAALPESLLESELFGIEGGVATGVEARRGKFELADEGTVFLDEIGDLHPALQVKLLRALQEREVTRVGAQRPTPVDVRVLAATHRDLDELVATGAFREDLYYRLRGVEIDLPPLRERREDIPHLVRHFADEFAREEGLPEPEFGRRALATLLAYDYPGNVRELKNVVEGAISLAEGRGIDEALVRSLLGGDGRSGDERSDQPATALDLETVERRHIARVLEMTDGNKSAAARILGIDRRTLQRKGF